MHNKEELGVGWQVSLVSFNDHLRYSTDLRPCAGVRKYS